MTSALVFDEVVEVADQSSSVTVVVSTSDSVPVSVHSGDFATVLVEDQTVKLVISEPGTGGGTGGSGEIAVLNDIGNVTEEGVVDGALLEFSTDAGSWRPTTGQRNQIYDGGNF